MIDNTTIPRARDDGHKVAIGHCRRPQLRWHANNGLGYRTISPIDSSRAHPLDRAGVTVRVRDCVLGILLAMGSSAAHAGACDTYGVSVQVLGSADAYARAGLASSSYLIWIDGKARVLIDIGVGSAANFEKSTARITDLDVILISRLHVDYVADLPALLQASLREPRTRPMPLYGPDRSKLMPDTVTFVRALFDTKRGAYRYLGELLRPLGRGTYKLKPHAVRIKGRYNPKVYRNERVRVAAAAIATRPMPVLAWRVQVAGKFIVFTSAMNEGNANLGWLGRGADLLVVESGNGTASRLAPDTLLASIARVASNMDVKKLALVHVASSASAQALAVIGKSYAGPTVFTVDMDCIAP